MFVKYPLFNRPKNKVIYLCNFSDNMSRYQTHKHVAMVVLPFFKVLVLVSYVLINEKVLIKNTFIYSYITLTNVPALFVLLIKNVQLIFNKNITTK